VDNHFVDLRLNHRAGQAEESFWPSFTDIMTVIVMIFLIAMVVLLLRNMELLDQLRATIASEQQAMELARSTGAENETLEERLMAREYELSMLRMQLMRMEEESEQQQAAISSQRSQIGTLSRERDALSGQVSQLSLERDNLSGQVNQLSLERDNLNRRVERISAESERLQIQVAEANHSIESLNQDLSQLRVQQESTLQDLASLRISYQSQEEALASARASSLAADKSLADLQTEYRDLKVKYDKLVRPARSVRGKTVVEVRYYKHKGKFRIDYKGPGDSQFKQVSRKRVDQILSGLKAKQPDGLYVKVILPKDSGLSYSEAWEFTNHLHQTYDYYYQEEAKKERMIEE
jgi:septal ring factor EnvC (AmiA/AmiB activator)